MGYPPPPPPPPPPNPTGYAYPYPSHHPPPPLPSYYYPTHPYYNPNLHFVRRLFLTAITILLLVGASTFVLWLILRPQLPQFTVSSAAVSSFNLSSNSNSLTSNFDLTLSVANPNKKMGVFYDSVEAVVMYRDNTISETTLPPFYQPKRTSTTVTAKFSVVEEYVDGDVGRVVSEEKGKDGAVGFNFRVFAWVRFSAGGWRTWRHGLRVYCDNVNIGFPNATASVGALVGRQKQCQVDL